LEDKETGRDRSERANYAVLEKKYSQPTTVLIEQPPSGKMAIDVYGQQIEPICSYRTCHHNYNYTDECVLSICYVSDAKRMKLRFTMIVVTAVYLAGMI
jgi:hypothetical protein